MLLQAVAEYTRARPVLCAAFITRALSRFIPPAVAEKYQR